jgi:hypothetical protein
MSKNRSNRNNKSVLKALRQKRSRGGRAKFEMGGGFVDNIGMTWDEESGTFVPAGTNVYSSQPQKPAPSMTGTVAEKPTQVTTTGSKPQNPRPQRKDFRGKAGQAAFNSALTIWK